MLYAEARRSEILELLSKQEMVSVNELAERFGVSKVSIRTDLDLLAKAGKLRRSHGGALSLSHSVNPDLQEQRINVNVEAKQKIARAAKEFVKDGSSVLLDTGTTSLELVRCLGDVKDLLIITADLTIADFVDRNLPRANVVLLGGLLRKGHRYVSGAVSMFSLNMIRADVAFICPTAFVWGQGFLTGHEPQAELKRAYFERADVKVVLMDATKIGGKGPYICGDIDMADVIIMDADEGGKMEAELKNSATRLIVA